MAENLELKSQDLIQKYLDREDHSETLTVTDNSLEKSEENIPKKINKLSLEEDLNVINTEEMKIIQSKIKILKNDDMICVLIYLLSS